MSRLVKGLFITFEGPDGSGKSTQIGKLAEYLIENGYEVKQLREPGGTEIGEQIRNVLHDLRNKGMTAGTEALLYQAQRRQLVEEEIIPHLNRGGIVLDDRHADSSRAYQGYGRGLGSVELEGLIRFATLGLVPDLTFVFDIDPEAGISRRTDGGLEMNRLDLEELDFHRRARVGYLELANRDQNRILVVDATQSIEKIQWALRLAVEAKTRQQEEEFSVTRDREI